VNLRFGSDGNFVTIYHMGGDPIPSGQYLVRANNNVVPTSSLIKSPSPTGNWVTGDTLTIAQSGISPSSYIQVVYSNGGSAQSVLATNGTPR
jgi:hypothetical protein